MAAALWNCDWGEASEFCFIWKSLWLGGNYVHCLFQHLSDKLAQFVSQAPLDAFQPPGDR